ncbi:pentatricopeptide repeat-containing protein At5g02830, chloroplastic isoform X2 [Lotus japonicus]|uniref:pentatricopeptide repeat-containing protein At5g02830, chloroplastic isoform X2 n=1 Tax=Lotus japonicus TaxID=34305 RepID=UPI002583A902|nr:pentatricopeptide repeat-containing protein At5g02830, chloroplastic isoform X2 [Lotus japonicus]
MRDFIILGSSIVTPPPPPPNSQPSSSSTPPQRHTIKPHKSSLPKLTPLPSPPSSPSSPWNISRTLDSPLSPNHYARVASKLAQDIEMVLQEDPVDSGVNVELLAKLVVLGIRGRNVWTVIDTLKKVQGLEISLSAHLNASAMDVIAAECRRMVMSGHIAEAVELMEVLARFQLPIRELVQPSDMIKRCVLSRNPKLAVRYASLLPHAHILFCNIISEFGKRRDLISALEAYDALKKHLDGPNMYIYRAIIDACGLCGDFMKSRYIYEDLLNQKITPNIYVFNSLMNVNSRDLTYTLNIYQIMQNLGLKPDMTSYNILLKACCVAGRVDLAQDMYKELKHLESVGRLKLDVFTYSTIIKVFADAKLWQMALKVKHDMRSAGVNLNTVAWSSLINACAHAGLVEQAIQLFEEMLLAGCEPNTQCFNIILHACVEACQYDRAFRFFHSWKGNKMLGSFGEGYNSNLKQGSIHNATTVPNGFSNSQILSFTERFPFTPTTSTYNTLLKACGSDYYHAKALINEMKTVGLSPNQITWSILIDICGGTENVEGAIEILKSMGDAGIKPDVIAYTTAIKVCVESKNFKQALTLYEEMKSCEIHPNWVTYNTLLKARSKYGSVLEVQQCLAIYQDMQKAGYKPNDYYLEELIEEWCEGVIQDNREYQAEFSSIKKSELERPQSLLLEKIAAHLLKRVADILAIDVQGLTKVEARLVILAVLRMIKENYAFGHSVNDDILIIIGATKADGSPAKELLEVQGTIIKLLRNELGLEVLPARTRFAPSDTPKFESPNLSNLSIEALPGEKALATTMGYQTRRPAVLQRLKVTKKSLFSWLQRKTSDK